MGVADKAIVLIAEGLGAGRIRPGPGTWGSLVGLIWFAVLLCLPNFVFFLAGAVLAAAASVWICERAEQILKQHDPSSVVIDEIVAIPFCFVALIVHTPPTFGSLNAGWDYLSTSWPGTGVIFILFRIFDIAKPWPISRSQRLRGGWGVTVDDLLAAVFTNLAQIPYYLLVSQ